MKEQICPIPVHDNFAIAARPKICGQPATVPTLVPMTNEKGENFYAPQVLCLTHCCRFAVWKLINRLREEETARRQISRGQLKPRSKNAGSN